MTERIENRAEATPNFLSGFFYRRYVSHGRRRAMCYRLYEKYKYVKMPPKPTKRECKVFAFGAVAMALVAFIIAKVVLI